MRYLKIAFLALLALILVTLALANHGAVEIQLLPEELANLVGFNWQGSLPLFLVILVSLIAGIAVGYVMEWFREGKHRSAATRNRREKARLEQEVTRLKAKEPQNVEDEVLALLETGPSR